MDADPFDDWAPFDEPDPVDSAPKDASADTAAWDSFGNADWMTTVEEPVQGAEPVPQTGPKVPQSGPAAGFDYDDMLFGSDPAASHGAEESEDEGDEDDAEESEDEGDEDDAEESEAEEADASEAEEADAWPGLRSQRAIPCFVIEANARETQAKDDVGLGPEFVARACRDARYRGIPYCEWNDGNRRCEDMALEDTALEATLTCGELNAAPALEGRPAPEKEALLAVLCNDHTLPCRMNSLGVCVERALGEADFALCGDLELGSGGLFGPAPERCVSQFRLRKVRKVAGRSWYRITRVVPYEDARLGASVREEALDASLRKTKHGFELFEDDCEGQQGCGPRARVAENAALRALSAQVQGGGGHVLEVQQFRRGDEGVQGQQAGVRMLVAAGSDASVHGGAKVAMQMEPWSATKLPRSSSLNALLSQQSQNWATLSTALRGSDEDHERAVFVQYRSGTGSGEPQVVMKHPQGTTFLFKIQKRPSKYGLKPAWDVYVRGPWAPADALVVSAALLRVDRALAR